MSPDKQAVGKRVSSLKARLEKNHLFRFAVNVGGEWARDDAADRAGAVAYYAFMSIFPLLLGVFALLGFLLPNQDIRQAVTDILTQALPASTDTIEGILDTAAEVGGVGGAVGLFLLLWSGSNMFAAINRAVNRAWGIRRERRFIAGKLRDLAMVLGTGVLLLLSLLTITIGNFVGEMGNAFLNFIVPFGGRFIGFLLSALVFLVIYKYVPNTPTRWRWTWPGALLAAVLFQAATYAFIFYLTNFADFQSVYGPLGSGIVLLLWIYISSMILILGAEVNSELHRESVGTAKSNGAATG